MSIMAALLVGVADMTVGEEKPPMLDDKIIAVKLMD